MSKFWELLSEAVNDERPLTDEELAFVVRRVRANPGEKTTAKTNVLFYAGSNQLLERAMKMYEQIEESK